MDTDKKKRNRTKPWILLLCLCLLLALRPQTVWAAGNGALTVYHRQEGARFRIFRVADQKGVLTGNFEGCAFSLPTEDDGAGVWQTAAQKLRQYAEGNGIRADALESISGGSIRFVNLEYGLYLVAGEAFEDSGCTNTPIPALIWVRNRGAAVYVKDEPDSPNQDPTLTPDPDPIPNPDPDPDIADKPDKPDESKLPQTGQLNWPVPFLIVSGLVLFAVGLVLRFGRRKDCHAE